MNENTTSEGIENANPNPTNRPEILRMRNIKCRQWGTVIILCVTNLLNYVDRYNIAGVLADIQKHFNNLSDDKAGLLLTFFTLSYLLCAPLFGYLGDRFNRKILMAIGVFIWSGATLLGSFMPNYWSFALSRALVGIGMSDFTTISPTVIGDMFVKGVRSKILAAFFFAIPVGSGLGYIVGIESAKLLNNWRWALRVTPVLGAILFILIIFLLQNPARGSNEGGENMRTTSWIQDLKYLIKNPSYMLSTFGCTCVQFFAGALAWWGPKFIFLGIKLQSTDQKRSSNSDFLFGLITMLAGLVGIIAGVALSHVLRPRWPRIDPVICAFGLFMCCPFLIASAFTVTKNTALCYTLLFLAQVFLNLNWSISADILMYVVIPTRRSTAQAFRLLIKHLLGDAGSPYLLGVISEALKITFRKKVEEDMNLNMNEAQIGEYVQFKSLQYSIIIMSIAQIVGGFLFLLTVIWLIKDRDKANYLEFQESTHDLHRYNIAGVLGDVQKHFDNLSDDLAGSLLTFFILSYMICAPLFGYLGDRYSRKLLMAIGVFIWSGATLLGSFMPNYWSFALSRALVGIGMSNFTTISPTVISDMFVKGVRSKMLGIFFFAVPVGSGLGYIVGLESAKIAKNWQWALRVTPILGGLAIFLILCFLQNPARGKSEGRDSLVTTSWAEDLKYLIKNPSFMLSSAGCTCVQFFTGALAWWGPRFVFLGVSLQSEDREGNSSSNFLFGLVTMLAGIVGIVLGATLSYKLKPRWPKVDTYICAAAMFTCCPFLIGATYTVTKNTALCYTLLFLAQVACNMNWSVSADMLLYVVIPTRRSSAQACQILMIHLLGDAGSPYLLGVVSEALKSKVKSNLESGDLPISNIQIEDYIQFKSLHYSILILCTVIQILGGIFFVLTSIYILNDIKKANTYVPTVEKKSTSKQDNNEHRQNWEYTALESPL